MILIPVQTYSVATMKKKSDGEELANEFAWFKYIMFQKRANRFTLGLLFIELMFLAWAISVLFQAVTETDTTTLPATPTPTLIK